VPITSVEANKSFVVFGTRTNTDDPDETQVAGDFTPGRNDQLTFSRNGTLSSATVQWYVVEFANGVTVQRGSTSLTGTTTTTGINAVDLTKAFPLVSYQQPGTTWGGSAFVGRRSPPTASFSSTWRSPGPPAIVSWQVIEYADAIVRPATATLAAGSLTLFYSPLYTIKPNKMWLVYGYTTGTRPVASRGT